MLKTIQVSESVAALREHGIDDIADQLETLAKDYDALSVSAASANAKAEFTLGQYMTDRALWDETRRRLAGIAICVRNGNLEGAKNYARLALENDEAFSVWWEGITQDAYREIRLNIENAISAGADPAGVVEELRKLEGTKK